MKDWDNDSVINNYILKTDYKKIADEKIGGKPVKVVANLPYYITTPIIMGLFEKNVPVDSITVMVQKQVADRMQVGPGTKDYGALSLAVFCLLLALPFTITGYIFSVSGALAHNCGQLLGAAALLSDKMAIPYAPVLLIAGLIVGSCTYMVSRLIFPAVKRIVPPKSKAESKIIF